MTVEELIKILEKYPKDCKVVIWSGLEELRTDISLEEDELSAYDIKMWCEEPDLYKRGEKVIKIS